MEEKEVKSKELASYREILIEMGRQLKERKGILMKRILYILWPVLLGFILLYVGNKLYEMGFMINESIFYYASIAFIFCWFVFAIVWGAVIRIIFALEKRIWVDSYFDKIALTDKESWKISKKLLLPSMLMRLNLFFRFYLIPFLLYIVAVYFLFKINDFHWSIYVLVVIGGIVLLWIYSYYLRIKLRFAWFLFLDLFGKDSFSYSKLFQEMTKLNDVHRGESFKKSLIVNLGTDTLEGVTKMTIGSISKGMGAMGEVGQVSGSIFRILGEETARQTSSFAKIAATYVIYRAVKNETYGESQLINDNIYSLR
jgi:MFS family permease